MIAGLLSHTGDEDLPGGSSSPIRRRRSGATRATTRRLVFGAMVLLLGLAAPGAVIGATSVSVSVAFRPPPVATIGSEVIVTGTIRRADRVSPLGLRVGLYIDGKYLSSAHADAAGRLSFRVSGAATSTAGTFDLQARFDGARSLAPARASAKLKLRPAQVKVTTVPAVSGIPISIGAATATTGTDGSAVVSVAKVGAVPLEAHLDLVSDPSIRVSFIRWGDQVYDVKRDISVRGDATFALGLRTAYRAAVRFVDEEGVVVDPTSISRARFTSSTGGELVLTTFDGAWWEAGTAVSRTGGLQPATTLWRLSEVEMAGTNVVNQGQQAFTPTINGTWTINLLLYDLVVHTQDALTGSSLHGTAELIFPDSTSKVAVLESDGTARFAGLPRGSYTVKLKTDGIAPITPIALSRTQDATIRVISYFDLGGAVGLALLGLLVLLLIGRRKQLSWLMRASDAPMAMARRLAVDAAPAEARSRLPAVTSGMAIVSADLVRVGRGRGAAALSFGWLLLVNLARMLMTLARGTLRLALAAGRRIAGASAGRSASPKDPGPSWPASTGKEMLPAIHPPVTVRTPRPTPQPIRQVGGAAGDRSWFDEALEDEGPTHECTRCHRQVPDSARFCRSCGHLQG